MCHWIRLYRGFWLSVVLSTPSTFLFVLLICKFLFIANRFEFTFTLMRIDITTAYLKHTHKMMEYIISFTPLILISDISQMYPIGYEMFEEKITSNIIFYGLWTISWTLDGTSKPIPSILFKFEKLNCYYLIEVWTLPSGNSPLIMISHYTCLGIVNKSSRWG